jgi:ketosteroid isomerase-like protein
MTDARHPHLELLEWFYAEESLLQRIHEGKLDDLREHLTDDVIWNTPPGDCPPLAGEHHGFDELVEAMRTIPLPKGAHVGHVEAMFANDSVGLALHHDRFKNADGDEFPVAFFCVFRFRDGKISEISESTMDPAAMWAFIKKARELSSAG